MVAQVNDVIPTLLKPDGGAIEDEARGRLYVTVSSFPTIGHSRRQRIRERLSKPLTSEQKPNFVALTTIAQQKRKELR